MVGRPRSMAWLVSCLILCGYSASSGCGPNTIRPPHLPEVLPPVWTVQPRGVVAGPPGSLSGCRKGRSPGAEKLHCSSSQDCVLTNNESACASCYCPFAYYAISRQALEQELRYDPKEPVPACLAVPCGPCGVCGPYDETHRPTRAICDNNVCRPDPPPGQLRKLPVAIVR